MHLVVFGLSVTSSWGNGHATLWRALIRALARRGHRITFFERDAPWYAETREALEIRNLDVVIYPDWQGARAAAARALRGADAGIVTSYCADGADAARLLEETPGIARLFYDLDTPVTLDLLSRGERPAWLPPEGLSGFDLVLSFTGGAALTRLRDELSARRVVPLYGSVDPDAHRPVAPVAAYHADLSYLGTYAADRQAMLDRLFIEAALRRPDHRFVIGGALYPPDFRWAENIHFVRHLPPPEHPAFFSSSRLTLNVTRAAMAALGWCPSGRLFEAAACGTPLLSDSWQGLEEFYTPGSEILIARDTRDTLAALDLDDGALHRIASRARERTLDEHSAARRALELEAALSSIHAEA